MQLGKVLEHLEFKVTIRLSVAALRVEPHQYRNRLQANDYIDSLRLFQYLEVNLILTLRKERPSIIIIQRQLHLYCFSSSLFSWNPLAVSLLPHLLLSYPLHLNLPPHPSFSNSKHYSIYLHRLYSYRKVPLIYELVVCLAFKRPILGLTSLYYKVRFFVQDWLRGFHYFRPI